jgi:hypothetical protein
VGEVSTARIDPFADDQHEHNRTPACSVEVMPFRPSQPSTAGEAVWYCGWECNYDATAAFWGAEGWRAAKGGWDLDCRQTSGYTWSALLDEIDAEEVQA